MPAAPLPDNETQRMEVLRQCQILDTAPDALLDDITRLAAHICGVPIAAVSLIDDKRQWFKSIAGLNVTETPREQAFCAHTILGDGILNVPDAQDDPRFLDNPLVTGDPHIRFYAGAPLISSDGYALGSLCVIDRAPRTLTPEQEMTLRLLASQAVRQIEMARRQAAQEQADAERAQAEAERQRLASIVEASADAILSTDLERRIVSWNAGAERLYGYTAAEIIGQPASVLVPPGKLGFPDNVMQTLVQQERLEGLEVVRRAKNGTLLHVSLTMSLLRDAAGKPVGVAGVARDITERKRVEAVLERERQFQDALLESLAEGIVACDGDGTLRLFNRAAREFHHGPEQPLPADQWTQAFNLYEADGQTPLPTENIPLFRAFQGEAVRDAEMVIAPEGGPARTLLASGTAIYGTHGEKLGAVVAMHDVTERMEVERALRESKQFVESIANYSTSIIYVFDMDTQTNVFANRNVGEFLGYPPEQVRALGDSLLVQMLHPDDLPRVQAHFTEFAGMADGEVLELEYRVRHFSGEWRWIWTREVVFKRHPDGTPYQIMGTAHDITERKQTLEELCRSEERLRTLMENAPIVLYAINADGIITLSEGAGLERLGLAPGEVVGRSVFEMYAHAPDTICYMRRALAGEAVSYDVEVNGLYYHNELRPQRGPEGRVTGLIGVGHDVTERRQAEETLKDFSVVLEFQMGELEKMNAELEALATMDSLTGLRNRRAFDERLAEEFERATRYGKSLSLLLLDIDDFKQYNDTFGHPAGDEVLRRIGLILRKATRDMDYLARYGGEEIAIILPETARGGALHLAERVRVAIASAVWTERSVTASIGVCTLQMGIAQPGEMVAEADRALYQSKDSGRNRVTFGGEWPAPITESRL